MMRMRIVTFRDEIDREIDAHVVKLGHTATDTSASRVRHEPDNPMADAKGDVKYPNVKSAGGDNRLSRRPALL